MVNMDEEISNLFLAYLMETCPAEEKKQPERYRVRAHQGAAGSYHEAEARRRFVICYTGQCTHARELIDPSSLANAKKAIEGPAKTK